MSNPEQGHLGTLQPSGFASPLQPPLLTATNLSFARGEVAILQQVNLTVHRAELVALVGPNGSGKTTLIQILLGLLRPDRGAVTTAAGSVIGYVPQRTRLDADVVATVAEIVATGLEGGKRTRRTAHARSAVVTSAIESVGLSEKGDARVSQLSGGQQQRVLIARALVREPSLLVLDEPVAGVDTQAQAEFHDVLAAQLQRGTGVLLVSHELSAVDDLVDRVIVLRHQTIEYDGPKQGIADQGVSLGVHAHDLPVWLERP